MAELTMAEIGSWRADFAPGRPWMRGGIVKPTGALGLLGFALATMLDSSQLRP
jgi:hypothetical protein